MAPVPSWDDIDAIAVTNRPGLSGALLVGVNAAKGIALARNLPLVGVHHIEGHIAANWLIDELQDYGEIAIPAVCLIVSGGHTDLIRMTRPRANTSCSGTTSTMPPARHSTRARGCLAWDIPADRPSSTLPRPAIRPRFRFLAPG